MRGVIYQRIRDAVDELGLEWESLRCKQPLSLVSLRRGSLIGDAVKHEAEMLVIAAYIVIGYLTGMRDSEVQDLHCGCVSIQRGADGGVVRHRLRGRTWKGKDSLGEERTWVVIEPVAHAIEVIEALHAAAGIPRGAPLITRAFPSRASTMIAGKSFGVTINNRLNAFVRHVNVLAVQHEALPAVPQIEGVMWRLTTSQFRRTLAWHIVNRPYGLVAGMIHFGHLSGLITEGYAGDSASGFRAELDQEAEQLQITATEELYAEWDSGIALTGAGAERISREFEEIKHGLGGEPYFVLDRTRLGIMLERVSRTLHPGVLNDCWHQAEGALCGGEAAPRVEACLPSRCPRAVLRAEHRERWADFEEQIAAYLSNREALPPQQVVALEAKRDEIRLILGFPALGVETRT